jgi:hypothetical protein
VTYLGLAVLMAAGLVGAGIGSDATGGIFDAISGNGGGGGSSGDKLVKDRIDKAEKALQANPKNQGALVTLVRSNYQLAVADSDEQGRFGKDGVSRLGKADAAWRRYLALNPKKPDPSLANTMVQAYTGLALAAGQDQQEKAKQAWEGAAGAAEIIATDQPSPEAYIRLTQFASLAGQTRKADLAGQKAVALAPKAQRKVVKQQVQQAKAASVQQQAQAVPSG